MRKFAPDLTFAPQTVAGRWPYVTVVASQVQISDELLQTIKASGAQIVDRIAGDVSAILADLVARDQRFLSSDPINPPDDSPTDPTHTSTR